MSWRGQELIRIDVEEIVDQVKGWRKLSGKTILITGSNGLLGSYLVDTVKFLNDEFLSKPCKIIGLNRSKIVKGDRNFHLLNDTNFTFIQHNVIEKLNIPGPVDYIFHAAGDSSPASFMGSPANTIDVNVKGVRWLLDLAIEKNTKSMVYFSSGAIYGSPDAKNTPTPETYGGNLSPLDPRACYMESKRLSETLCKTYADEHNVPVKIVRPFVTYGPGITTEKQTVQSDFMKSAIAGKPIEMQSGGKDLRSDCYITDATVAFWLALFSDYNGQAFNVGNDSDEFSIKQLAQTIHEICGIKQKPTYRGKPASKFLKTAPKRFVADITKARKLLGYRPKVSSKEGLTRTIEWNKAELGATKDMFMVSCAILCRKEGMAEYFKQRCENFALVTVIPQFLKEEKPKCEIFHKGELVKTIKLLSMPDFLVNKSKYFIHVGYMISIIYAVLKLGRKYYHYLGEGHIYSLTGVLLKKLGYFEKIIYSSGDYFIDEPSFQVIDKYLTKQVDAIWSATQRMCDQRIKTVGKLRKGCIQAVMPLGVEINYDVVDKRKQNKNVLFIGNIQKHQGLDLFLDIMPDLVKKKPGIKLHVIGSGNHVGSIKQRVEDENLSKYVTFYGFVDCDSKLQKIFSKCFVGIALYHPETSNFTRLSDPGKIKDYISYGLPVITTDVFQFSEEIAQRGDGFVVPYEEKPLLKAILKALKNQKKESQKAVNLAVDYEWEKILNKVYGETKEFWNSF